MAEKIVGSIFGIVIFGSIIGIISLGFTGGGPEPCADAGWVNGDWYDSMYQMCLDAH